MSFKYSNFKKSQPSILLMLFIILMFLLEGCLIGSSKYFHRAGYIKAGRIEHTATLLTDGRILIAGGVIEGPYDNDKKLNAEIYDPKLKKSKIITPLNWVRHKHTATLLKNGKVFLFGGDVECDLSEEFDKKGCRKTAAEIFIPETERFKPIIDSNLVISHHTATLLPGGKVLIIGGTFNYGKHGIETFSKNVVEFSPDTETFKVVGHLSSRRYKHTAIQVGPNKILLVGGYTMVKNSGPSPYNRDIEIYDTSANKSTVIGQLVLGRIKPSAILLKNGHVLVAGGDQSHGFPVAELEEIDLKTGFSKIVASFNYREGWGYFKHQGRLLADGSLNSSKGRNEATLLPDGTVLFTGGRDVELYDPTTHEVKIIDHLNQARFEHTTVVTPDYKLYVLGGVDYNIGFTRLIEEFNYQEYKQR